MFSFHLLVFPQLCFLMYVLIFPWFYRKMTYFYLLKATLSPIKRIWKKAPKKQKQKPKTTQSEYQLIHVLSRIMLYHQLSSAFCQDCIEICRHINHYRLYHIFVPDRVPQDGQVASYGPDKENYFYMYPGLVLFIFSCRCLSVVFPFYINSIF